MTYEQAKAILETEIDEDGGLYDRGWDYMYWVRGQDTICLDGSFTPTQLEAIAVYMRGVNLDRLEV